MPMPNQNNTLTFHKTDMFYDLVSVFKGGNMYVKSLLIVIILFFILCIPSIAQQGQAMMNPIQEGSKVNDGVDITDIADQDTPTIVNIDESSPEYKQAFAVATAVDTIIRSARANYTKRVVGKLKKDGVGAAVDSADKKGFAPLPAQYIRAIAHDVAIRQKRSKEKQKTFGFFLRSRWNLNLEQDLRDDFERDGWEFISKQQEDHLKAKKPIKTIEWKPYIRTEIKDGQKVFRYLSADPASAISCIKCHNQYEQREEIKELRRKQGVEVGKIFSMDELMGALSIYVNLDE